MRLRSLACAALTALLQGCPGSLEDTQRFYDATAVARDATVIADVVVRTDGVTFPDTATGCALGPDYVERTLFPGSCAMEFCHRASEPAAGLDLATPGFARRLVGVRGSARCRNAPLVDPANPEASLMLTKLRLPSGCGGRMPLGGEALDAREIDCVRRWVIALTSSPTGGDR